MNTPLNDDIQQKARDLARKITVAHDLDPEIQEELYGHIEDKLLGYMSGEEQVSEADAFILVREHFGDAKALRGLLQEVHAGAAHASENRLLLVLIILTLALGPVVIGVKGAATGLAVLLFGLDGRLAQAMNSLSFGYLFAVAGLLGYLFCLLNWKRSLRSGGTPWFYRQSMTQLSLWALFFAALHCVMPGVVVSQSSAGIPGATTWVVLINRVMLGVSIVGLCAIWFWWLDAASRLVKYLHIGAAWVLFHVAYDLNPVQMLVILGDRSDEYFESFTPIFEGTLDGTEVSASISYPILMHTGASIAYVATFYAVGAAICTILFWLVYRISAWQAQHAAVRATRQ